MPRRIDLGDAIAALGAVLLLIALFLEWFDSATAWEAFESLDLVLALLAIAALGAAIGVSEGFGSRLLAPLGVLLLFIVVIQIVEPPPIVADADVDSGAWLALAASSLILLGGAMEIASFSVTVSVGGKDARRRVPAVDRRQGTAPPPGEREGRVAPAPIPDEPTQPFSALDDK